MGLISTTGVKIEGITACVPSNKFDVKNYAFKSDQDKNDFIKRVGVESKRIALPGTTSSDLCYSAAESLIADLGWDKEEIGALVLVTQTPDHLIPFGAAALQFRLGLSENCATYDLHMGCSGWVYGLSFLFGYMKAYGINKAILLAGETSHIVSENDASVFPLIGDAGTATALSLDRDETSSVYFNVQSFGENYDSIIIQDGGARHPFNDSSLKWHTYGNGSRTPIHAEMNGLKILEFSLKHVPANVKQLMQFADVSQESIDYFVFHQANKIICESLRKRLAIPENKFPYSINQFGNTSSASIPLTIVNNLGLRKSDERISLLCCSFGVGLSIASMLLNTDSFMCGTILEV